MKDELALCSAFGTGLKAVGGTGCGIWPGKQRDDLVTEKFLLRFRVFEYDPQISNCYCSAGLTCMRALKCRKAESVHDGKGRIAFGKNRSPHGRMGRTLSWLAPINLSDYASSRLYPDATMNLVATGAKSKSSRPILLELRFSRLSARAEFRRVNRPFVIGRCAH